MPYTFGTKSESIFMERIFSVSTTWSPPFDCRAYVTVIGAGASGASARNTSDNRAAAASGGGAGGCGKSLLRLDSSVTYYITIGAGGTSVTGITGTAFGVDGEKSVFADGSDPVADAIITATGGIKGIQAVAADVVATQAGGVGGSATGGNIWNVTGGAGGSATVSWYEVAGIHCAAAGGGAPGVLGESFRGGNALLSVDGYNKYAATGGGGVGGRGGDATLSGGHTNYVMTQGGSGDHDGDDVSHATASVGEGPWNSASSGNPVLNKNYNLTARLGTNQASRGVSGISSGYSTTYVHWNDVAQASSGKAASIFHGLTGQGGLRTQGDHYAMSGPGAGGGGYAHWAVSQSEAYMSPGLFGGGGAGIPNYGDSLYNGQVGYVGAGSFGAGGGAIAGYANSSNAHNSGTGGAGLVVVTILEAL